VQAKKDELIQYLWDNLGVRVGPFISEEDIISLLNYDIEADEIKCDNPFNAMRDEIIAYIADNSGMLSLPCHGRCYEHCDLLVLNCHNQLPKKTKK
jgi:hypothetical protein